MSKAMTDARREELIAFLDGSGTLDGVWFGENHPTERGAFWWRKELDNLRGEAAQPVAGDAVRDWPHIANEWADMATSCVEGLRNIRDGICTVDEAMTNAVEMLAHCREVNDAAPMSAAPAAPPTPADLAAEYARGRNDGWEAAKASAPAPVAGGAVKIDVAMINRLAREAYEVHSDTPVEPFPNDEHFPKWRAVVCHVIAALAQDRASQEVR